MRVRSAPGAQVKMMSTKTKYVSIRIVVDGDDERLCGQNACPMFRLRTDVSPYECHLFDDTELKPVESPVVIGRRYPMRRCDGCLTAKEL